MSYIRVGKLTNTELSWCCEVTSGLLVKWSRKEACLYAKVSLLIKEDVVYFIGKKDCPLSLFKLFCNECRDGAMLVPLMV